MASVGTAEVEVEISKAKVRREADAAGREIEQSLGDSAGKAAKELEDKLGQIRIGAGLGVAAAAGLGLGAATKAASDLNETTSKSAAVFGEANAAVVAYAKDAAQGIGLSEKAALDATSTFGNLFTQLGVGQDEAANLSTSMVTLAADFGSFFNEDPARIIEAQTAAFRGEYDALQRYVPTINAAAVEQRALTETGKASADQLTAQEKALATYALMMEGAGAAQGDFARTSDSAANAAKRAGAEIDNSAASLGQALLPVSAAAAEVVGALAGAFGSLPGPLQTGIVGIGGFTLAAGLLAPKLVEGAQLMKLAGSKALSFGRDLIAPTRATEDLGAAADGTSSKLGNIGGALTVAATGLLAYNTAYGALESLASSDVDTSTLSKDLLLVGQGASDGQRILDQYGGSIEGLADRLKELQAEQDKSTSSKVFDFFSGGAVQVTKAAIAGNNLKNEFADLDKVLATLAETNGPEAAAAYGWLTQGLIDQGVALDDINAAFPAYNAQVDRSEEANSKGAGAADKHATAQGDLATETKKASDVLREQADAARAAFDAQRGVTSAEQDYVSAVQAVDDARRGVADAEREVDEAERGVADAHQAVADAQRGVADAMDAVTDAREGVADAERAVVDAQAEAAQAARDVTTATEDLAQARADARWEAEAIQDAYQGVVDAEEDLRRTQEDSLAAQQSLDEARANYGQTLAGLARDAGGAADDVLSAEIRLREAQQRLAELGQPDKDGVVKPVTEDERLAAEIAIREAERRLETAREREAEARAEYERNQAAGVEGSDAVVEAHGRVEEAADNEADAQGRLEDAVLNVAAVQEEANARVVTAQDNLTAAIGRRAEADQAVVDAKEGVVDAHDRVRDAVDNVEAAQRRVRDATDGVNAANQRVVDARDGVVTAQHAVEKAVDGVTDSVLALAMAQFALDGQTGLTKDEIDAQIIRLEALRDTLAPNNPLRRQLDDYIERLKATNGNFVANVSVNFENSSYEALVSLGMTSPGFANAERRAKGGPVRPGVPYIVGEERAEVFWPDQAGTIIPSTEGFGVKRSVTNTFAPTYNGILDAEEASALANAEWSWRMSLEPA